MKRVFGAKKDKLSSSIQDTSDRINKRGETVDEKIKKLDTELARCREQIKRTRPGPAQEAIKARAMRILKQKRVYEGQRDMLNNQTSNLDQVAFASEEMKDSKKSMAVLKSANKELKGMMKTLKIQEIDTWMLWKQTCGPKFMVSPLTFNQECNLIWMLWKQTCRPKFMVSPLTFNLESNLIWNLHLQVKHQPTPRLKMNQARPLPLQASIRG